MKRSARNNALTVICLFLILLIFSARSGLTESTELKESISANTEQSADISALLTGEPYFYTPTGAKYHFDKNCRYLKNSTQIQESDQYYLEFENRSPCSACTTEEKEDETTEAATAEPTETTNTEIYYFTKAGTKYHTTKDCRYLKRSKEILQGGKQEISDRKLTPCSACAQ